MRSRLFLWSKNAFLDRGRLARAERKREPSIRPARLRGGAGRKAREPSNIDCRLSSTLYSSQRFGLTATPHKLKRPEHSRAKVPKSASPVSEVKGLIFLCP